jgi:hypothetical protein
MNQDFKIPPAALNGSAALDTPDIARGLAFCTPHLPEDCREAHSFALDYFTHMARRFPDGVAPRDLPPSDARVLLMAMVIASVVGRRSHANSVGKN